MRELMRRVGRLEAESVLPMRYILQWRGDPHRARYGALNIVRREGESAEAFKARALREFADARFIWLDVGGEECAT